MAVEDAQFAQSALVVAAPVGSVAERELVAEVVPVIESGSEIVPVFAIEAAWVVEDVGAVGAEFAPKAVIEC